jgi:DNA topoisomerase-2
MYQTRKDYMICALKKELLLLSNKAKYIMEILNDTIDLRKKKKETIFKLLADKGYAVIEEDSEYKYLVKMPMDSVTEENVDKLNREHSTKKMELDIVTSTTVNQMWTNELDKLSQEYLEYKEERERLMSGIDIKSKKKVVSKGVVTKKNVNSTKALVIED